MIIQLDCDGVIVDFTGGCLKVMRGMGFHFTHADVQEWDISALLHEEQRPEFWRRVKLEGFCYALEPIPGAIEAVGKLRTEGHEVRFLTSAMPGADAWKAERMDWLKTHLGGWKRGFARWSSCWPHTDYITFAHDKAAHPGDILIDDKPEHVSAWLATGRPAILVDQPYNRGAGLLAPRARDIGHAAELILARSW
jgi:5'(3')-deoxyribonucleotidase